MTDEQSAGPSGNQPRQGAGVRALGRLKSGEMNKAETAYAEVLAGRSDVAWWKFEGVTLNIAPGVSYRPDFFVMLESGELQVHEVKGRWEDDAWRVFKVARDLYPFDFLAMMAKARPKRDGGGYSFTLMGAG
ncbi:MAG: hypothetical protein RLZZ373_3264 [Pseudomonadota bacterium]|jgi:hypothetical protein